MPGDVLALMRDPAARDRAEQDAIDPELRKLLEESDRERAAGGGVIEVGTTADLHQLKAALEGRPKAEDAEPPKDARRVVEGSARPAPRDRAVMMTANTLLKRALDPRTSGEIRAAEVATVTEPVAPPVAITVTEPIVVPPVAPVKAPTAAPEPPANARITDLILKPLPPGDRRAETVVNDASVSKAAAASAPKPRRGGLWLGVGAAAVLIAAAGAVIAKTQTPEPTPSATTSATAVGSSAPAVTASSPPSVTTSATVPPELSTTVSSAVEPSATASAPTAPKTSKPNPTTPVLTSSPPPTSAKSAPVPPTATSSVKKWDPTVLPLK